MDGTQEGAQVYSSSGSKPVTLTIIVVSCGLHLLELLLPTATRDALYSIFGLIPYQVLQKMYVWTPLTCLFFHGSPIALGMNMYTLWNLSGLEPYLGSRRFLGIFLLTGVGCGLFIILLDPMQVLPHVGSAGSLLGLVMVCYLEFDAHKQYLLIWGFISFVGAFTAPTSPFSFTANLAGLLFAYLAVVHAGFPFGIGSSDPAYHRARAGWQYQR